MTKNISYPKYPEYKDSGVEWLDDASAGSVRGVPAHWEILKMKYLFKDISQKGKPNETLLSVTQNQGVVPRSWVENRMVMPSGNLDSFKFIQKGDFAISLRSFEGGLEYCHHDGIISPAYTVLKIVKNQMTANYYRYLLKSSSFISEIQTSVVGIREGKNISYPELSYSLLPLPPKPEQTAIAHYLDDKCAKIDRAIAQKERLIELLQERKQIIIQEAVTGKTVWSEKEQAFVPLSLSEVEGKDSGVEWIGEVPAHWEVKKIKYFSEVQSGVTLGTQFKDKKTTTIPYLRVANVQNGYFDLSSVHSIAVPERLVNEYLLRVGDILVTEGGDIDKLGRGTIWNGEITHCLHQNHIFAIRVIKKEILPKFLSLALASNYGRKYFISTAKKTTNLASTNRTKIINFQVVAPSLSEQEKIVHFLEKRNNQIKNTITLQQTQIEKLKEYKATLIDSVVRGKVKVV